MHIFKLIVSKYFILEITFPPERTLPKKNIIRVENKIEDEVYKVQYGIANKQRHQEMLKRIN